MIPKKLILVAMTLLGGCAFAQMPGASAQHVQVEKAVTGKDSVSRRSIGHVEAQKTVHVRAAVEGFLKEVKFEEGSIVEKGTVIFLIDPVRYDAAYQQADAAVREIEAQIAYADASCKRIEYLMSSNAASKEDAESAKAKLEELKARLAEAQANLVKAAKDKADCEVRAEITGRIGRMAFAPGNYITQGEQLGTITQTDPIYVRFPLSQSDVNGLFDGPEQIKGTSKVRLTTAEGRPYPYKGKVEIVDNQLTGNTDTYTLWATFPNAEGKLTHGGIGVLHIEMEDNQQVVQVPLTAVHHDDKGAYVYVISGKENIVERRNVTIGSINGRMQSIMSGVAAGEVVVTDGSHKTRVGVPVVPVYPEQQVIRGAKKGKLADIATPVKVATVTTTQDPTVITCQGARVEAIRSIALRPLVHGVLQEQAFQEGDMVQPGVKLFSIDPTRYQAAVAAQKARIDQLEVRVEDARNKYERQTQLEKATSKDKIDSAKATMNELEAQRDGAKAALLIAEDDLSRCVIRAGLGGHIGRATFSPGNYISDMKTPLALLVQMSPIYVRFSLSETAILSAFGDSGRLVKEADITLVSASGKTYKETGDVAFCDNVVQSSTDTQNVWAVFKNEEGELRPGSVVTIHVKRKPDVRVMAVPANAVQIGSNGYYVYVMKDGRAVATRVWCGDKTADGKLRIVYSGIEMNDKIIISGLAELEDGDAVTEEK